jgi:hypothetical protein
MGPHHRPVTRGKRKARPLLAVLTAAATFSAAMALALAGCAPFWRLPLTVIAWSPSEDAPALSGLAVWVEFSAPVDAVKAEQAFSLTENGSGVDGIFSWSGNRVTFTPCPALSAGNDYEISVDTSVEDPSGVSLDKEFSFRFTTKTESGRPSILSFTPAADSMFDDRYTPVTLVFSEPVDRGSFYAAFFLSPPVAGTYAWNGDGTQCSFTPLEPYEWGTEYRVEVSTGLEDLSGNRLAETFRLHFTVGTDTTAPTVTAVRNVVGGVPGAITAIPDDPGDALFTVNENWESIWGFEMALSEPVPRLDIEGFFSFEPAWDFRIDSTAATSQSFILIPEERLVYGAVYTLTVRQGLPDAQGNTLEQDAVYRFRVNGAGSTPPELERIRFRTDPGGSAWEEYTPADIYTALDLNLFPGGVPTRSYFDLYVRTADGAGIDLMDLMECFSISATNGCASFAVLAMQESGFDNPQPDPPAAGTIVARVVVDVINAAESGIVTLRLSAAFKDSEDNPIAGAWELPLLK